MYEPTIIRFAELAREKADASRRRPGAFFVGAMLAGAYIGIAMILALSAGVGLPAGVRPLVMGAVFGIGLILTVFAGAELFTGYIMYAGFALARRFISGVDAARMLTLVWVGNLAGALILAGLFVAGGGGPVFADGANVLHAYVAHKVDSSVVELLARAILCNWLVCLAIWGSARMQGDAAKCIMLAWVLMAFVTPGFEHSIANMTALSIGLWAPHPSISLVGAVRNLVLVSIGNAIGGLVFVVGAYLAAARTDAAGPAPHDVGASTPSLRSPTATPAE